MIGIVLIVGLIAPAWAHPPKHNDIGWDAATSTLTVRVLHPVKNGKSHFVIKIKIFVNGKEVAIKEFSEQQNGQYQQMTIAFDKLQAPRKGDEVTVVSHCNIAGKKKATIVME